VTGGYDNTASCFLGGNAEAHYRGWSGFGAEVYLDFIAGDYLGSRGGEVFGGKAGVKANNDSLPGQPSLFQVVGYCLSTYPYVIEGKVLGNNSPPAVGTEFNEIVYPASSPLFLLYTTYPVLLFSIYPLCLSFPREGPGRSARSVRRRQSAGISGGVG